MLFRSRSTIDASSGSSVKLDPALLRTGTANDIMGQLENRFGIPRDEFAQNVMNGRDPREILTGAPQNAIATADMNKAITAAQNMTDAEKKDAMANSPMSAVQTELLAKMNEGGVNAGAGGQRTTASSNKGDEELLPLGDFGALGKLAEIGRAHV